MIKNLAVLLLLQGIADAQDIQFPIDVSQFTNLFGNFPNYMPTVNNNNDSPVSVDDRGSFGTIVKPQETAATLAPPIPDSARCNCVPYHACTDNKRSVDVNSNNKIEIQFFNGSCEAVLDVCCGKDDQPVSVITTNPPIPEKVKLPGCGVRNEGGLDFTITDIDPKFAGFAEFPWTVALIDRATDQCSCGGSLILPQVVLTAAHCASPSSGISLKVRAGEWDTQTQKERLPYEERNVQQIIQHPKFNDRSLHYDMALLILESPFTLNSHINTVCLPTQNYQTNSANCFATGWGKDKFGASGVYSVIMKKISLPMVPSKTCENKLKQTRLSSKFKLHNTFVCAGGVIGRDTCEGDGGAPLHCPVNGNSGRYVQTGIVAWGIGCNTDVPAVYANVASMRNWIDETLQSYGFDITSYSSY
uniref:Phenoloxidase-activating factor 2 n=1 Tax=Culicoides sonorensis TaxID=179676 RepID=A0A336KSU8_CULSO